MKILTLGPEGTFSHQAALTYPEAEVIYATAIADIFDLLSQGFVGYAIVPLENSVSGTVYPTLDGLMDCEYTIEAEIILPIEHNLVGFAEFKDIKRLYVHPHSYEQCRKNLLAVGIKEGKFEEVEVIFTTSNAMSAKHVLEDKEHAAALLSSYGAKLHKIPILKKTLQDAKNNQTRFVLLSKNKTEPTKRDRTSLVIFPQKNRRGLLCEVLELFSKNGLNLTKIESRPSRDELGEYFFYIDFEGHIEDSAAKKALSELKSMASYRFLGSYPIQDE